jgi:D-3-phosphoglycerate dehydrogenase
MRIVVAEPIILDKEAMSSFVASLEKLGHEVGIYNNAPSDDKEMLERIRGAGIVVVSTYPMAAGLLQQLPDLKFIVVAFTGYDHIDLVYCKANRINVANAPGYSTTAVAEQTLLMILSVLRKTVEMNKAVGELRSREGFLGSEISGKTVGIVGFGNIGKKVAEYLETMGARIVVAKRNSLGNDCKYEVQPLCGLLQMSDIVSLHVPLNDSTKALIGSKELAMMKSSAILINTARGAVVVSADLAEALHNSVIAGAAVDIFESEPPLEASHPLLNAPNVFLLPHTAYATEEALTRRLDIVLKNIVNWLNQKPENIVA